MAVVFFTFSGGLIDMFQVCCNVFVWLRCVGWRRLLRPLTARIVASVFVGLRVTRSFCYCQILVIPGRLSKCLSLLYISCIVFPFMVS